MRLEDELPLDPRDPRLGQPADRLQQAAARQGAAGDVQRRAAAHPATARTKTEEAKTVVGDIAARIREKKRRAQGLRHPLPHQRAAAGVRDGAAPGEDPLRADGRHVVLRSQGSPRHPGLPEAAGQSGRRGLAAADHQHARPRHRPNDRQTPDGGGHRARQAAVGDLAGRWTSMRCFRRRPSQAVVRFRDVDRALSATAGDATQSAAKQPDAGRNAEELLAEIGYKDELARLYPDAARSGVALGDRRGSGQRRGLVLPAGRRSRRWPAFCRRSP